MKQKAVWNKIAEDWNKFRNHPDKAVEFFLKNKKGKILDLGSGSGRNFHAMNKKQEIYAVDFSKKMLKLAEQNAKKLGLNVKTKKSETHKLKFPENFFDTTICWAVLHCIKEKKKRQKTLKEIYRTLKPKSQALISVWSRNSKRLKNKSKECFIPWTTKENSKQERYTYVYDYDELKKDLQEAGFKIIRFWKEKNINAIVKK
jgi:ubiquinone/menaquinone biosynthesis C-methylase UbiE